MMKLLVVLALCSVAYAGYAEHGHGHGHGYGHAGYGHGHGAHAGYGHGNGWRNYQGWANVNSHLTANSYNYGLQESGKGYNKYVWQGADTHHVTPVKSYGHGH